MISCGASLLVGFQEDLHEQAVHSSVIQHDLFVALPPTGRLTCQFQSIQSTFPCQSFLAWIRLLHQHRQQWIIPQLLVIVQIFVAQSQTIDSLGHHLLHRMFDQIRIPIIGEAGGKLAKHPDALLDLPQQQTTAITGDRSTVELRADLALL
jgi:hypothetical protein